ncbi:MAG: TM2 domain-containing protein [Spirochaetota bacterium]
MSDVFEHPEIRELSDRNSLVVFILALLFGTLGVHRFYVGRVWTGLLWFFTGGLALIGWVIDIITILTGSFKDSHGREICKPFCAQE